MISYGNFGHDASTRGSTEKLATCRAEADLRLILRPVRSKRVTTGRHRCGRRSLPALQNAPRRVRSPILRLGWLEGS
jgi:hypothetical protein